MHVRSSYAEEGGPENLILSFIKEMDSSRFSNFIVSIKDQGIRMSSFLAEAERMGIKTERIKWKSIYLSIFVIKKLVSLMRQNEINIIHTHDLRSNFVGYIAGKIGRIPIVTSVHGWIEKSFKFRIHNFADKMLIRFFNRIIVNSEFLRKHLSQFKIPDRKISTVYNTVDISIFERDVNPEETRKELGIGSGCTVIGTVGRLNTEKGHKYLLEAARDVLTSFPKTVFLIVGKGPLERELKDFAREAKIFPNVLFTGFYQDLQKVFNVIDLFVLPSLSEALPLSLLEAMAAGRPVIATNVGGIPEVVKTGETGIVVNSGVAEELAQAMITLLENKDTARELAKNGQELVREQFSTQAVTKKLEAIYRGLQKDQKLAGSITYSR
ncbi:MAG: glycosyltransferase family 4 protein [Candidatus Aminicenantes bacterium]|nr:MAG: glycosyltransferase family 4 protein [Candidatus Aminicenantes bacterium]